MSKAADASWSIPCGSCVLSMEGFVCVGPKAGLGRMEVRSGRVWIEGPRVRGENAGDVSDICALGGRISGEAEAEAESEYE